MFTTSEQTEKLDEALAKAQGEIEPAAKDKVNPAFRSKYADLASVWGACRTALAKHNITLTQWPLHSDDGRLHLITRLAHAGQWMQAEMSIPVGKPDAHGYGSAMTYAKRYSLAAAIGVVADDDDDGNAASQPRSDLNPTKDVYAELLKALENEDGWHVLQIAQDQPAFRLAFGRLTGKQKTDCKGLEQRTASARFDYANKLTDYANTRDELGTQQLLAELGENARAKQMVWDMLDAHTKTYIKNLTKKEAA
jgi:hypothetical protein